MSVVNVSDRSLNLGAIGSAARDASRGLGQLSTTKKNEVLAAIAAALRTQNVTILKANALDVEAAKAKGLDPAIIDRLTLSRERLEGIAAAVDMVEALPDPVGAVDDARRLPNGLEIGRRRVPLGVVAVIFEARPNVTVDISALCLKAGNAVILRGGREAVSYTHLTLPTNREV